MRPTKDEGAVTDLLDVLLEEGVVLQADVVISVAEVPLVGVNLRAAIAGMTTMTEYGFFEEWDRRVRERSGSDAGELDAGELDAGRSTAGELDAGRSIAGPAEVESTEPDASDSGRSELRPSGSPDGRQDPATADPGRHRPDDPAVPADVDAPDDRDVADGSDDAFTGVADEPEP